MCAMFASKGCHVSMLISDPRHLKDWEIAKNDGITLHDKSTGTTSIGAPKVVTVEPAEVIPEADAIFLVLPARYNHDILKQIMPYIRNDPLVISVEGGWWGHPKLLFHAQECQNFHFCELACLPWAAREIEYGKSVEILGPKEELDFAVSPSDQIQSTKKLLEDLMEMPFRPHYSLLGLSLSLCCNWIHPTFMWGHFHKWDGKPIQKSEVPKFYADLSQETCDKVEMLEKEMAAVHRLIHEVCPKVDLSSIRTTKEFLLEFYGQQITDKRTLLSCFQTNPGYQPLYCPTIEMADGDVSRVMPDFNSRYLASDIPYGLLVMKGIAEIFQLSTPTIDSLILWGQAKLGKEWLQNGKLLVDNLQHTAAPQRYGCLDLPKLIEMTTK
eukprot:Platyproteum_vivax@DN10472_c0_g1_i1.p1